MGKKLGDADDPLLVSVRSGAKFSMPGMMDTVLNIGLNDESVEGLAKQSGSERFAWDSYRRLVRMFGKTVLGVDGERFSEALDEAKQAKGTKDDLDLDEDDLSDWSATYKEIIVRDDAGRDFPQDPREQLDLAIRAVFDSWNGERARLYRRQERIPHDLGTAVNIVSMVFGNLGPDSGTGVAFTRDPGSGDQGVYGDYLQNAQGEDVVAGIRNTVPLADLEEIDKASYDQLMDIMSTLERHYQDLCDIEFTIERGKLWMLQTRVGKRTAGAAFRIATQLVDEGLIDLDEALTRVTGAQLAQLMFPRFDADAERDQIAKGVNASPGAAVGKVVFDSEKAARRRPTRGEHVILVRRETTPDDLHGMIAAKGILTSCGGKTSHAAVVARGMGKTCVSGADELGRPRRRRRSPRPRRRPGPRGRRHLDRRHHRRGLPRRGAGRAERGRAVLRGRDQCGPRHRRRGADELVRSVHRLITHADEKRRLGVRTNADTAEDSARARRFGAAGHRPVPHRAHVPRRPPPARRGPDPRRGRRGGRARPRRAAAAAAGRLRRDLRGDGRAAGHGPADRPAAARVPAVAGGALRPGRGRRGAGRSRRTATRPARCSPRSAGCTSRTRCSACAACASAWSSPACSGCRCARSPRPPPS